VPLAWPVLVEAICLQDQVPLIPNRSLKQSLRIWQRF